MQTLVYNDALNVFACNVSLRHAIYAFTEMS